MFQGNLYAIGGNDGTSSLNKCESYDPFINKWTQVKCMGSRRAGAGVGVLDGYIYAVGTWSVCFAGWLDGWMDVWLAGWLAGWLAVYHKSLILPLKCTSFGIPFLNFISMLRLMMSNILLNIKVKDQGHRVTNRPGKRPK